MTGSASLITLARVDRVGTYLSLACAVHCMAAPLVILTLSVAGIGVAVHDSVHALLVAGSVALAAGSLCWGFRTHRDWRLFLVLGAAVALIILAQFFAEGIQETGLMVAGAGLLVTGHLLNRRLCQTCTHCEPAGEAAGRGQGVESE